MTITQATADAWLAEQDRRADEHFAALTPAEQIADLRRQLREEVNALWGFSYRQDDDIREIKTEAGL